MRLLTLLPLLIASASTLAHAEEEKVDTTKPCESDDECEKAEKQVCESSFAKLPYMKLLFSPSIGSPIGLAKDGMPRTWKEVGAAAYLDDLLKDNTTDWSDRLFHEFEIGGGSRESSYDCKRLGKTSCGATPSCKEYKPRYGAYFVHASIASLYSSLNRIHEDLQDIAIWQLSAGIKHIEETFGPQDKDLGWLLSIIGGVFGAISIGPVGAVTGPLSGVTGMLGGLEAKDNAEKPDLEGDMEKSLGRLFAYYTTYLKEATKVFFSGDFSRPGLEKNRWSVHN